MWEGIGWLISLELGLMNLHKGTQESPTKEFYNKRPSLHVLPTDVWIWPLKIWRLNRWAHQRKSARERD